MGECCVRSWTWKHLFGANVGHHIILSRAPRRVLGGNRDMFRNGRWPAHVNPRHALSRALLPVPRPLPAVDGCSMDAQNDLFSWSHSHEVPTGGRLKVHN